MNLLKERAKQFIIDRNFIAAKQAISVMLENEANQDFLTHRKMGDVCVELNQYSEALLHYKNAAALEPKDALAFVKIGNLCHEHLNDIQCAVRAFERSIAITPTESARVLYAKLLIKLKQYESAERLLSKCSLQTPSVNYYLGVLLRQKSNIGMQNLENAIKYFERATQLKPEKYAYHHDYAQCLAENGDIECANKAYLAALKAMQCANCEDYALLLDYAVFRCDRYKDYTTALQYLQLALDMEGCAQGQQSQIECKKREIEQRMHEQTTTTTTTKQETLQQTTESKTITYSFERSILYWKLPATLQVQDVQRMSQRQIEDGIFGGVDRLHRLRVHFGRLLSAQCKPKLVVACVSVATPIAIQLLMRVGLLSLFDAKHVIHSNLIHDIDLELPSQHNNGLNGLTMDDMKRIECRLNVFTADLFDIDAPSSAYISSPVHIANGDTDARVQNSLRTYVIDVQRIIKKFEGVRMKKNYWTILNVLSKAVTFINNDDLMRWYAVCLAGMCHCEKAQLVFQDLVSRKNLNGTVEYALFLLSSQRYHEAKRQFDQILSEYVTTKLIDDWMGCIYCGVAQCLEAMNEKHECEQYYEAALKAPYKYKPDGYRHYYYGLFLFREQRWVDSQHQFQNALSCDQSSCVFHYAISQSLFKTKHKKMAKVHLIKAVDSQVDTKELKQRFYAKFDHGRDRKKMKKNGTETGEIENEDNWSVACASTSRSHDTHVSTTYVKDHDVFAKQFDMFWFDDVNQENQTFNKYYDLFLAKRLNDIRIILHERNLKHFLQNVIGIKTPQHIQLIFEKAIVWKKEQQKHKF